MTTNLDRATETLREITYIHQPVADGARITATKSTLTAGLRLLAATEMTEATE